MRTLSELAPNKLLQRQCSVDQESPVANNLSAQSSSRVLKRAMTLPVKEQEQFLGPRFNYAPLRSPLRPSNNLVPNSETSETLLDVPILVSTAEDKHEMNSTNVSNVVTSDCVEPLN